MPLNPATFQPYGGHYIIHFGKTVSFDGRPPNRFVVIAFDSMQKAGLAFIGCLGCVTRSPTILASHAADGSFLIVSAC